MARQTKPKLATISRLLPNAIILSINGEDITVPLDKHENAIASMILTAQARNLIQRSINHWKDMDEVASPKELNDITNAIKNLTSSSAEIYAAAEPLNANTPKQLEQSKDEDISFDDLSKLTHGNDQNLHQPPEVVPQGPAPVVEGQTSP